MTSQGDPYRTLGIAPDASLNEIRSAYRRLAKQYHPDAAGERALPRFLAIRAAYETLVDGEGRLRPPGWWTAPAARTRTGGTPDGAADPWRAEASRARASRDAWRARRSGGATSSARTGGGATGTRGTRGGAGANAGPNGGASRPPGERQHHARRGPRKATPGSTSYDEAAETPLDPSWEGGAWYGPNSGTFWTINPREYADPRKHGPEYLARARRAAEPEGGPDIGTATSPGAGASDPASGPASGAAPDAEGDPGEWAWTGAGESTTTGGGARWGTRSWRFEAHDAGASGPAWTPGTEGRDRDHARSRATAAAGAGWSTGSTDDAPPLPDLESLARLALPEHLLQLARRDARWRLLLALVAWPPIGYAIGGTVSAATGCATFSASCPEPVPVLLLLVQPLIIGALFALPVVTGVAAFASLAALAASIPFGAVLSVGALPEPVIEPTILAVVVAATYTIALVAGAVRLWRRPRGPDATP